METTIQHITQKKQGVGKNNKPWTIYEVMLADGRKADTFENFKVGEVVDVEIIENENPNYNPTLKRTNKKNYVPPTNMEASKIIEANNDKERRITMLSCISSASNYYAERQSSPEDVKKLAEEFFELAWKKKDELPF